MAVKTSDSAQSTVLLRRPLPPKIPISQKNQSIQSKNSKGLERKREKLRKREYLSSYCKENQGATQIDLGRQACNLDTGLVPYKPRRPDALPTRQPRRVKENPYECATDGRFLPPLPEFTLEQFIQQCQESGRRARNELVARQFIGRSDDSWFFKRINDLNKQQELCNQVIDSKYTHVHTSQ